MNNHISRATALESIDKIDNPEKYIGDDAAHMLENDIQTIRKYIKQTTSFDDLKSTILALMLHLFANGIHIAGFLVAVKQQDFVWFIFQVLFLAWNISFAVHHYKTAMKAIGEVN